MPELPEVERFRQILMPLVNTTSQSKTTTKQHQLKLELYGDKPPRKWVSKEDIDANNTGKWCCTDILRKGKLLCMVLESMPSCKKKQTAKKLKYFFLHMGMTGRVVSKTMSCSWGHKYVSAEEDGKGNWPPRFTYLLLTSGSVTVAFADPRKFGSCYFSDSLEEFFGVLAPDGWTETRTLLQQKTVAASGLANQRLGVKALLLDQKRVVSGVGNWVVDEVLYQCELHPDQSYLTDDQTLTVVQTLHSILQTAVDCLNQGVPYPETWLFGFRWTKKKAGKDNKGRNLSFLTSGGRTSAIVASIQKLRKSQGKRKTATATATNTKTQKDPKVISVVKVTSSIIKEEEANNGVEIQDVVVVSKKRRGSVRAKNEKITNKRQKQRTTTTVAVIPDKVSSLSYRKKPTENPQTKAVLKKKKKEGQKKQNRKQQQAKKEEKAVVTQQPNNNNDDNDEKEALLLLKNGVDQSRFRELGFAKWNRMFLPIIELGPYHVPPGPVRNEWIERFEKKNQAPRLVYWYGSTRNDLSSSFSFLSPNAIISYEQGLQQGRDQLSSNIQKKVASGKELTAKEDARVKGLAELKEESVLSKKGRLRWLNITEEED